MDKLELKVRFEEARKLYPGTKRGLEVEFDYFLSIKKFKFRRKEIILKLVPAINRQIAYREQAEGFVPEWKHFKSWIYNSYWTLETPPNGKKRAKVVLCRNCGQPATGSYGNVPHCPAEVCRLAAGDETYRR